MITELEMQEASRNTHKLMWEVTSMLKKLRKNKKGFTLAELLIVVAIIGVLVAISIPIFTAQLEKSREAVDEANLRSVYAEVASDLLTEPKADDTANKTDKISEIKYTANAESGDTYVATVTATQTDTSKWASGTDVNIGGQTVKAAASWTITGNVKTGKVTIEPTTSTTIEPTTSTGDGK
jgi:prepilin-type N-terminal cleavage/methylation domain-containing protein